ncbi:MAG: hypothetical protein WB563_13225 [Pseudolabrys sp.]|jgi:hypothetical protein
MPYKYKHNREEINALLQNTLAEIGPEKFSGMRLVVLEKLIRSRYASQRLPGKTILREIINNFRSARWPETAPRLRS